MKNKFIQSATNTIHGHIALHSMVNRISISYLPSATRKRSLIINDIPKDLEANTDENMLATVLGSLLDTVIGHTESCCIRISAKVCDGVVLVYLKENQGLTTAAFTESLRQVQQLAKRIGGSVSINNINGETTTIAFSFINNSIPLAA